MTGTRRYAVLDLDGTLYPGTLGLVLLNALNERGVCCRTSVTKVVDFIRSLSSDDLHTPQAAITAYQLWADAMVGVLPQIVRHMAGEVWHRQRAKLFPFARPMVNLLHQRGFTTVLLSGSPQEIVQEAAWDLGIDHAHGAEFHIQHGVYSGRIGTAPGVPGTKLGLLRSAVTGFRTAGAIAIGNSATDFELLDAVDHPVAFEPDSVLHQAAVNRGWSIVDRTSILAALSHNLSSCSTRSPAGHQE